MAPLSMERPTVLFTAHSHQIISNCIHLFGLSILSFCLAHYIPSVSDWRQWTNLSWGRLCVILVLFDSWFFIFFTGILVNGVGLSFSPKTCALAIYACISFYALTKVLIYAFLVEKVYIVWAGGHQMRRFNSPAYRICAFVMLGYVAILILMIVGENSSIREDGICIIGLKNFATIPLISYDLFLNVFLTAMFIWPLWRSTVISPTLKKVATRTLHGAIVSLTTSAANVAVLTFLKGEEYGWVCLGSCVTDVALNAIAISWVMAGSNSNNNVTVNRISLQTPDVSRLKHMRSIGSETIDHCTVTTPIPDSYYDYLPRDQVPKALPDSKPQPEPERQPRPRVPKTNVSKRWIPDYLKPAWARPQRTSNSVVPLRGISVHVVQSVALSEETAAPTPSILQVTEDVNGVQESPREGSSVTHEWNQTQ